MKSIYIAWASYQRRAISMQPFLGFDLHHVPPSGRGLVGKLFGYIRQGLVTAFIVLRSNPDVVFVQLPPNFLVHLLLVLRALNRKRFRIVLDCHNASVRAPWLKVPLFGAACRASDLIIIHNSEVELGFPVELGDREKLVVLEDPASSFSPESRSGIALGDHVLVPCSFHDDEPVDMVLAAARLLPDVQFKVTGKREKAAAKGYLTEAPENVEFTGFVSEDEFNRLLFSAALVAGITTFEGIQLSVASEAIGAGKALLLSDTRILRAMFGDCAAFFSNTPRDFADAVRRGIHNRAAMEDATMVSLRRRNQDWERKANEIFRFGGSRAI